MRRDAPRLVDRQPRAVPVDALGMAHQQHAQLVGAGDDLVHHQPLAALQLPVLAGEFVQPTAPRRRTGDRRNGTVGR